MCPHQNKTRTKQGSHFEKRSNKENEPLCFDESNDLELAPTWCR